MLLLMMMMVVVVVTKNTKKYNQRTENEATQQKFHNAMIAALLYNAHGYFDFYIAEIFNIYASIHGTHIQHGL